MTRTSGNKARRWISVILVALVAGCTQEVETSPFTGASPISSIGSGPVDEPQGDEADAESSTTDDATGDDGPGDPSGDNDGGPSPATTSPAPTDDGESGSGDPVLDACLEIATTPCETCACDLCLEPLYACQQDPGCVAMRDCAEQSGCAGAECLEPCGPVIDRYGGPFGESGALALTLSECLSAACPVCF